MCRIAAYFGPPLPLTALLQDPPHGLLHQSQAAREMSDSSVAGDGWGIGWFSERDRAAPGMLKSILPLWSDLNARTATHAISSGSMVGHIRLASPGLEVCFTNTPLYVHGNYLYTMNGSLHPWPGALSRALRSHLRDEDEAGLQGTTDAEMLGALWHTCLCRMKSRDEAMALRAALRLTRDLVREHEGSLKTNVIVAGRNGFTAVRYAESEEPNSLYYLTEEPRWHGGTLVASEPFDDSPGWQRVEPSTLVLVDRHGLRLEPLNLDGIRSHSAAGIPSLASH